MVRILTFCKLNRILAHWWFSIYWIIQVQLPWILIDDSLVFVCPWNSGKLQNPSLPYEQTTNVRDLQLHSISSHALFTHRRQRLYVIVLFVVFMLGYCLCSCMQLENWTWNKNNILAGDRWNCEKRNLNK